MFDAIEIFGAIGMGIVKTRAFVGLDVSWNVNTSGLVGLCIRWNVKTRGFVDLGPGGEGETRAPAQPRGRAGAGPGLHEKYLLGYLYAT